MKVKALQAVPAKLRAGYAELIAALRAHWHTISALSTQDAVKAQKQLAPAFLASTPDKRRKMARAWFGSVHAEAMASRTTGQWVSALRPMLDTYVADVLESESRGIRREFQRAARLPYFIRTMPLPGMQDNYFKATGRVCPAAPFPSDAGYDDIYEHTAAGISIGHIVGILLATGEPISANVELIQGIFSDFKSGWLQAGPDDSWKLLLLNESQYQDPEDECAPWARFGWPIDKRAIFVQVEGVDAKLWCELEWPARVAIEDREAYFPGEDVADMLGRQRVKRGKRTH